MKILHVVSFFKPSWEAGGIARVCYEQCIQLVARGHEVTVYTTDGFKHRLNVKKNKPLNVDGIKVYYFRNLSNIFARTNLCIPYLLPYVSKKELKNFDIIHIHTFRGLNALPIWYYAKKYKIPYVLQAHGSVLPFVQKQRLKYIFDLFFGHRILNDASKVIALTKTEAEQYKKMGVDENKIEIVPNGLDLSDYQNLPDRGTFRKKYGIKNNDKIVLYLGRIHKNKGIDLLVDAFIDISKGRNDIRLVLIGPDDGNQESLVERTQKLGIDNNILFTGFVKDDEKIAALVDADVFITPSFSGFPVTFLEACACGTPIITTNRGDNLDWIDDRVGYVIEYDKNYLRDAICKILFNEELRTRFKGNCKDIVNKTFDLSICINKLEGLYKKLVIMR